MAAICGGVYPLFFFEESHIATSRIVLIFSVINALRVHQAVKPIHINFNKHLYIKRIVR